MSDCCLPTMLTYKLLTEKAFKPAKLLCRDVGLELYACEEKIISAGHREYINTGISLTFPHGYTGMLVSLPELAEQSLDIINTIIENEINSVKVLFVNNTNENYVVRYGDPIAMIVIIKYYNSFVMIDLTNKN